MKQKELKIGDLTLRRPIFQGGMGVGVSLGGLAGAVAAAGGAGAISAAQIGFREPDFDTRTLEANLRAMDKELNKARRIAKGGVVGFNIMVAMQHYADYVRQAVKGGADFIVSGAGLPVDLPGYAAGSDVKLAPIVSTEKSAAVILKYRNTRKNFPEKFRWCWAAASAVGRKRTRRLLWAWTLFRWQAVL